MKITIERMARPERSGDWHDKPLRWAVKTGAEVQRFSTKKEAERYRRVRRKSASDVEAIKRFSQSN